MTGLWNGTGRLIRARRAVFALGLALALLALAGAASPGVARAGVAKVIEVTIPPETPGDDPQMMDAASYTALPGEANRVRVSPAPAPSERVSRTLIEDLGAAVTVGAGCTLLDAHHARCDVENSNYGAMIALGDMDDTLSVDGDESVHAGGGPGADRLSGGAAPDTLDGGGGAGDVLSGGAGMDTLSDGDGVGGAAADSDTLDGGPGTDMVSYAPRTAPVTVALPASTAAGQAGEGDRLSGFEDATGGHGDDTLNGDAGRNSLDGGPGADNLDAGAGSDRVEGGAGEDSIEAGAGRDVVAGGKGDDSISLGSGDDVVDDSFEAKPTGNDTIACGSGSDRILAIDAHPDRLARDCERFTAEEVGVDGPFVSEDPTLTATLATLRRHGSFVTVAVRCNRSTGEASCILTGVLRSTAGATLGKAVSRVRVKAGRQTLLRLRLTAAGIRRVHAGKRVRLVLAEKSGSGIELLGHARSAADVLMR